MQHGDRGPHTAAGEGAQGLGLQRGPQRSETLESSGPPPGDAHTESASNRKDRKGGEAQQWILTKANHFIRHFEFFCYYCPKNKEHLEKDIEEFCSHFRFPKFPVLAVLEDKGL